MRSSPAPTEVAPRGAQGILRRSWVVMSEPTSSDLHDVAMIAALLSSDATSPESTVSKRLSELPTLQRNPSLVWLNAAVPLDDRHRFRPSKRLAFDSRDAPVMHDGL